MLATAQAQIEQINPIPSKLATAQQVRDTAKKIILASPPEEDEASAPMYTQVLRQRDKAPLCLIAAHIGTDQYKLYGQDAMWASSLLNLTVVMIGRYNCLIISLRDIVRLVTLLPKANDIIILPGPRQ